MIKSGAKIIYNEHKGNSQHILRLPVGLYWKWRSRGKALGQGHITGV